MDDHYYQYSQNQLKDTNGITHGTGFANSFNSQTGSSGNSISKGTNFSKLKNAINQPAEQLGYKKYVQGEALAPVENKFRGTKEAIVYGYGK